MIDELKLRLGSKVSSINVNGDIREFINIPLKQMKFCEAVCYSFNLPIRLTDENLGCPGARRCIGFDHSEAKLANTIAINNNIPIDFIRHALQDITILKNIRHINLGMTTFMEKEIKPDLYIIYAKPAMVTAIMRILAKVKKEPSIPPYFLLSVCGNVFANCYKNKTDCISFGCPESRIHGGIEENETVIAIPFESAEIIVSNLELKKPDL